MMNMTNCVVRIPRLDLPLDVVVKVPLWDEEIWEESASSRKQGNSLWHSVLHEPVQEAEKENFGEALDWMSPYASSSGSLVNVADRKEEVTQEVLTGPEKQQKCWNVLNQGNGKEKSVTKGDRGSRSCIVSGCMARVVHLPRHLRRVHQWSPQQALNATEKTSTATCGRRTRSCIVDGCTAVVVHLPRHLRQVHYLGPSEIRSAIFGSKKPRSLTSRHSKKQCPQEGCGRVSRNIYQHMRKFHKLEKGRRGWSTMLKWNVSGNESGDLYPTTSSTWRIVEEGSQREEPPKQEMKQPNNQRRLCGKIRHKATENGEIRPCGRGTKSCIVSGCTAVVIHLPRHLRQVHQWSPKEAQDAVHSLRKPLSPTSRPLQMCPVEGCGRMAQRIPQHLRKYHKLRIGSLAQRNIKKALVELEGQDGSIHGPEVVESSIVSSSKLSDNGSGELPLHYPTTTSTYVEDGLQGEEPPQDETVLPNDQRSPCSSITDKATENGEIRPCGRGTKSCIVSGCTAVVIHLPRHLRQVHQWNPKEARDTVHSFRKPLSPTSHPLQMCPVEGCGRMAQRIPQHLRQYHKLRIGSLAQRNIQKAQVELEGQDGSIHGPEVVESSIISSSELSDDGGDELPLPYPTTTTYVEEGLQGEEPSQDETVLPNDQRSPCSSITEKATENGEIRPCGRGTKSCIVSGCTAVVIHLPRHLRQVHQWSPKEARDAAHSLRKPWSPTSRPLQMCPVEGCGRMGQRIPQHLRKYHKLHIGSLAQRNIKKAQVELEGQDGSIHGPEVVESSIVSSSELSDNGSGELPLPYPTTTSTYEEERSGELPLPYPTTTSTYEEERSGELPLPYPTTTSTYEEERSGELPLPYPTTTSTYEEEGSGELPLPYPTTTSTYEEEISDELPLPYQTTTSTYEEEGLQGEEPPQDETVLPNDQRSPCSSITEKATENGEIKPCGRGTKSCIVSGCTAVVIHLPRHLRQVHQWSPKEARDAVHSLRKPWSPTSRPLQMCPVEGCGRMAQRIPQHLRKYH
ncbi:uncharacterized protein LOC143111554 [Alosa pseudoharengus]|uniref:uncharacterized protein LOC143111554 n=1 Tax=Alosa pseudoharengus TaxID=34774 RepID=UPI003F8A5E4B